MSEFVILFQERFNLIIRKHDRILLQDYKIVSMVRNIKIIKS